MSTDTRIQLFFQTDMILILGSEYLAMTSTNTDNSTIQQMKWFGGQVLFSQHQQMMAN